MWHRYTIKFRQKGLDDLPMDFFYDILSKTRINAKKEAKQIQQRKYPEARVVDVFPSK